MRVPLLLLGLVLAMPARAQPRDDRKPGDAVVLVEEARRQLQAQAYDQALANFLAAYDKTASAPLLLDIATTLRDLGRLADAANTYQRYLNVASERRAEVEQLLAKLDEQLTTLSIHVPPHGARVSIDGGPFVAVGESLITRVRPGLHLVRVSQGNSTSEITLNGFEGETKDVPVVSQAVAAVPATTAPERVDGWLITGTHARADAAPLMPQQDESSETGLVVRTDHERRVTSGVLGIMRVDGKGRGVAGGAGIAYAPADQIELEAAALRSDFWGAYVGARYRFLLGRLRPYAGAGMPMFFFTDDAMETRVAIGLRAAGGVELEITPHLSAAADLGLEHFFNVGDVRVANHPIDATVFVPTLSVIGRM